MDPATISLIVGLVIKGVEMGYSYYSSTQDALKQARIQQSMIEADKAQVALALNARFPNVTFDEWLSIIDNALITEVPQIPDEKEKWKSYAPYVVIGVIFLFLVYRR